MKDEDDVRLLGRDVAVAVSATEVTVFAALVGEKEAAEKGGRVKANG